MVICKICSKEFKRITRTHLKNHNLTTKEYLENFPGCEIISSELKIQYGNFFRENNPMKLEENKKLFSNLFKGRSVSDDTRKKLSESKIGKKTKPHSEETKRKISESNKKTSLLKKQKGISNPPYVMSDEARERASNRMKGNKLGKLSNHNKGKKLNLTEEQRNNRSKKRVEYLSNNKNIRSNTSIEKKFMEFLNKNNIDYIHQYPIHATSGSWLYDFYLPTFNLLVELDGEFWHSTLIAINRDKIKNKIAKEHNKILARISSNHLDFNIIFKTQDIIWKENFNLIQKREEKYVRV